MADLHPPRTVWRLRSGAVAAWRSLPAAARWAASLSVLAAVDFALCRVGLLLTPRPATVALFWPAAGLVFGALSIAERRHWPAILLAAGLPIAVSNALSGQPPLLVVAFALTNALEPTLAALLVSRLCGGRPDLVNRNHLLALVLAGPVAVSGLCSLLSAGVLRALAPQPLFGLWLPLWAGSGLGTITVGPLLLAWSGHGAGHTRRTRRGRLAPLALGAVSAAAVYLVFLAPQLRSGPYEVLLLPPLIWIAIRYGLKGATAGGSAAVLLALAAVVGGTGAFGLGPAPAPDAVAGVQVFCFVVVLSGLFLAAAVEDRARAAAALQESEEKYRLLVENQTDLVAKVDGRGRLLFVSPSYCRTFGKSEAELLGTSAQSLVLEADRENAARALAALSRPPHVTYLEHRAMTAAGLRWMSWAATAVVDAEGRPVEIVSVGRDITERKELEERLRQSEKLEAIGRLAGGVAHDFNNQLTAILASTEYLASLELPGEGPETLAAVRESALRSAGLTRQLLAFSRKQPPRTTRIDVGGLLDEVTGLLRRSIDKRITLDARVDGGPIFTLGDPDRIHAAVLNLALNARDAMPEGGRLTLRARPVRPDDERCAALAIAPGAYVELAVSDTGVGMSEETRRHLFEPFFTTKAAGKGSGLGLAEVYGTVKAHRGAVTVVSAPGRGTTFFVLLPATEGPATAALEPPRAAPRRGAGRPLRVIVVDDERNVRRSLALLLRLRGCEVVECGDGAEALRRAAAAPDGFDLAMVDMVMPGMAGPEVVSHLRTAIPSLPVIVSSGFSPGDDIVALCAAPRTYFLQKPYTDAQLEQALARAAG